MEELVSYSINPNLSRKVVEAYDGTKEYRSLCRLIKDNYYIKNKQCFLIDNVWYRIDSGLIEFDHFKKEWFIIKQRSKDIAHGIIDFKSNGEHILGYFTRDPYNNVIVIISGSSFECINEEIALKASIEAPSRGVFIHKKDISPLDLRIRNVLNNQDNLYNCDDDPSYFDKMQNNYKNWEFKIPKRVHEYATFLGDITFGVEMECIRGYLPSHIRNRTGTIICRDGSLKDQDETQGPEYTTVPYSGAKGITSLIYLSKEISKRNNIDKHCSLHLHIGNIPTTRTFIVTLYKLCLQIQDDLFKMFPYYKNNEVKFAGKNKNYCQKLFDNSTPYSGRFKDKESYLNYVHDTYLRIYKFLLEGNYPSKKFNRKNKRHPRSQKWERHSRYFWINLINLVTSQRNTVEFRLHTPTLNPQKIISWLFICNAIIKTALYRTNYILNNKPISIYDVLNIYSDFYKNSAADNLSQYLVRYYEQRCAEFKKDFDRGDYLSLGELSTDSSFNFDFKPFTEIFK